MSIFKSTFKPFLCRQVNARQDLLSMGNSRPIEVQQYTLGKSPFVKMTSFVNYDGNGYSGDQLARKYVLEAGTLYQDPNDPESFSLRYGYGAKNSAYGGNLGNRQYGMVPMPGISEVSIKSKSAYGSLREATIKFYAWDKKQFDELEVLFMRIGYTVLLEWGWSKYIDTYVSEDKDGLRQININDRIANNTLMKSFDIPTINPFLSNLDQDMIYQQIQVLQRKTSGNYNACLGKIVDFSWEMLPNGGFECTTVLVSLGDILDSLKMNTSTGDLLFSNDKKDYKDEFGLIMELIKSRTPNSELNAINQLAASIPGMDITCRTLQFTIEDGTTLPNQNYIQFAYLVHILNERFNLYTGDKKYLDIEIPLYSSTNRGNGLCLASKSSISIDPLTCTIKNSQAKVLLGNDNGFDLFDQGFKTVRSITLNVHRELLIPSNEFLYEDTSLGVIGNIYVSIEHVMDLYNSLSKENNGSVYIYRFLKRLLDDISFALGSINDFDIFVEDNKAVIIDKHYTEFGDQSAYDSKFQLNLIGNNSAIRQFKVQSRIFQSQTAMIAIAAQDRVNVGGLQSSTNVFLNKGMKNRLTETLIEYTGQAGIDIQKEKDNIIQNQVSTLLDYVENHLLQLSLPAAPVNSSLNNFLNSLILKVNTDANFRAVIPILFEFSLDGIGGVTIGEIFTVNQDSLPAEYMNKNIGFIITGIQEHITRDDWQTSFTTQICVLDQNKFKYSTATDISSQIQSSISRNVENSKAKYDAYIIFYNRLVKFISKYFNNNISFTFDQQTKNQVGAGQQVLNFQPYDTITSNHILNIVDETNDPDLAPLIVNMNNGNPSFDSDLNHGVFLKQINNGTVDRLLYRQTGFQLLNPTTTSRYKNFILNPLFYSSFSSVRKTKATGASFDSTACSQNLRSLINETDEYFRLPSDLQSRLQKNIDSVFSSMNSGAPANVSIFYLKNAAFDQNGKFLGYVDDYNKESINVFPKTVFK